VRIVLLSRFPRFDRLAWKADLFRGMCELGLKPQAVIYDSCSWSEQAAEAFRRFGPGGAARKLLRRGGEVHAGDPASPRSGAQRSVVYPGARHGNAAPAHGKPPRLERLARDAAVPVHQVPSHNQPECLELLRALSPDLILLLGTRIIRKPVLEIPRIGVLNPHYGPLPEVRGMNATEWAVWLGKPTGVTIHFVAPGIDQGDILHFEPFPIDPGDSPAMLRAKCQTVAVRGFLKVLADLDSGVAIRRPQRPEDGRQYYTMNVALKRRLANRLRPSDAGTVHGESTGS